MEVQEGVKSWSEIRELTMQAFINAAVLFFPSTGYSLPAKSSPTTPRALQEHPTPPDPEQHLRIALLGGSMRRVVTGRVMIAVYE